MTLKAPASGSPNLSKKNLNNHNKSSRKIKNKAFRELPPKSPPPPKNLLPKGSKSKVKKNLLNKKLAKTKMNGPTTMSNSIPKHRIKWLNKDKNLFYRIRNQMTKKLEASRRKSMKENGSRRQVLKRKRKPLVTNLNWADTTITIDPEAEVALNTNIPKAETSTLKRSLTEKDLKLPRTKAKKSILNKAKKPQEKTKSTEKKDLLVKTTKASTKNGEKRKEEKPIKTKSSQILQEEEKEVNMAKEATTEDRTEKET